MFLVIIYDYKINTVQKTTGDSGFFMPVYRGASCVFAHPARAKTS